MGLFDEQIARKPNLYPWTEDFINSIYAGFWTPSEFNFRGDYGQFKTELTDEERDVVVRCLSAIGQVEIAVKTFWAKLGENLPHPSISDLGYAMANTEVVHNKAYEKLLDVLHLGDVFEENLKVPVVKGRVNYLRKYLKKVYGDDKRKQYVYAIILFTLFVENVSLFSQFYVVLWFNRFKKGILSDTAQQVQYTRNEECYVAGTEVLTPSGWRLLSSMAVGDPVMQFNTDTRTLESTTVLSTIAKPYSGDAHYFSRAGHACGVTENHDMITYHVPSGEVRKKKAKDVKFHKEMMIPVRGERSDGDTHHLTPLDRIRIAIQADGSRTYWVNTSGERLWRGTNGGGNYNVSLKKRRKIERMDALVAACPEISVGRRESSDGYTIFTFSMGDVDLKSLSTWVDLSDKSGNWCKEFIEEAVQWDGHISSTGHREYFSTHRENCDILHAIGTMAGYAAHISERKTSGNEAHNTWWSVYFREGNPLQISHGVERKVEHYEGDVSCISVPSGAIMTRLNGKTFIAGNCLHAQVGIRIINTLREEYPELFDDDLKARIREEISEAYKAEAALIDWMMGEYEADGLSADLLKAFVKKRINDSMHDIGYDISLAFTPEQMELLPKTTWMDEELYGNNMTDFFKKRPVEYAKKNRAYSEEDLF